MKKESGIRATLFIDTSNNEEIVVGLFINEKKHYLKQKVDKRKSQVVLYMINDLLNKYGLELTDLTNIKVNLGPGSFTGLRVGVTIANTLGTTLHIPINDQKPGLQVYPIYE